MSAPRTASADLNANIVFDGASSSPPWWAMLRKWRSSHGLGSGDTACALVAPNASARPSVTPIEPRRRLTDAGAYRRRHSCVPAGNNRSPAYTGREGAADAKRSSNPINDDAVRAHSHPWGAGAQPQGHRSRAPAEL